MSDKKSIHEIEIIGLTSKGWLALQQQQEDFEAEQESLAIEDAELEVVGRIEDNTVIWYYEEPQNTIALWNDDDPEGVQLKPKPSPQQNEEG